VNHTVPTMSEPTVVFEPSYLLAAGDHSNMHDALTGVVVLFGASLAAAWGPSW